MTMTDPKNNETHQDRLIAKYNLQDIPLANTAYGIAYEYGHSSGEQEVENYFIDLLPLLPTQPIDGQKLAEIAAALHYPECWDTMAYPTILDALFELSDCNECKPKKPTAPIDAGEQKKPIGVIISEILQEQLQLGNIDMLKTNIEDLSFKIGLRIAIIYEDELTQPNQNAGELVEKVARALKAEMYKQNEAGAGSDFNEFDLAQAAISAAQNHKPLTQPFNEAAWISEKQLLNKMPISSNAELRGNLVEAIALSQGWEESAVKMVDEIIMPVIRAANQTNR